MFIYLLRDEIFYSEYWLMWVVAVIFCTNSERVRWQQQLPTADM